MSLPLNERGKFPTFIDNSMRQDFVSCPHQFYFRYILRRSSVVPSIHLHAGGAFARGVEVVRKAFFVEGKPADVAISEGVVALVLFYGEFATTEDDTKTVQRMADALVYYFSAFPLETDFLTPHYFNGNPGIEFNFSIPLPINNPDTGEPLIYTGRFDMIADYNAAVFGVDEKTASQLGPTWGKKYDLSSQFQGYAFGAREYGVPLSGFVIRGIAILKTQFNHAQHILYCTDYTISRWYQQLLSDIRRMLHCYTSGYWDYNLAHSCGMFGGCSYIKVCATQNELTWIDSPDFGDNTWNPLTRGQE